MSYPKCLIDELAKYGKRPTGNLEWDRAVLQVLKLQDRKKAEPWLAMDNAVAMAAAEIEKAKIEAQNLADPNIYQAHVNMIIFVANEIVLKPQNRRFEIDEHNKDVLRFLLYYFNECPLAEDVFPGRGYKLHKNIMLQGNKGVGKTMIMQIFSEYLRRTKNPRYFVNVSVTQMVNHFSLHNNIDLYTYNEEGSTGFQIKPHNLCLNDIGVENRPFYGIDTLTVVADFLHARNELWANMAISDRKFAHLTTNLDNAKLTAMFNAKDAYGRIVDRFKTYNVIPLTGDSRR
ncbi:putative uncharacterized protein [Prevotella sp. CAG:873]|jgi:hypothetical protein|nr:putative uncharacterized protein [Prevotella sp. CAG:873]